MMASKLAKKSASAPLVLGTTSPRKSVMSYRWVITDAKVVLKHAQNWRSPTFSVFDAAWSLLINGCKSETSVALCLLPNHRSVKTVVISNCTFSIIDSKMETTCTTTAPDTKWQTNDSHSPHVQTYGLSRKGQSNDSHSSSPCECLRVKFPDIDKYICNGTLTIQVDETIFDITNPIESTDEEQRCQPQYNGVKSLLDDQLFVDVTIKCGGKKFQAHKAILASQSPVFKRMLVVDMKEKKSNTIDIPDAKPNVIWDMLSYFYTGRAPNICTLAKELLVVADKYEITPLFSRCENLLLKSYVNATSVVDLLLLAGMHNAPHLKKACLRYIYCNSEEVHKTNQWKQLKENCDEHALLMTEIVNFSVSFGTAIPQED